MRNMTPEDMQRQMQQQQSAVAGQRDYNYKVFRKLERRHVCFTVNRPSATGARIDGTRRNLHNRLRLFF
jgi:hypothetical protein